MGRLLILCVMLCVLPFVCDSIDQASFYGGSYILVPLKEAKATTDIRLKFRTQLSSGLILLAAGEPDYCIVYLQAGSLKVKMNLGAGETELSSPQGLILNDLLWHDVDIQRKDANITMTIDNDHKVKKHLAGDFFELNIHFGVFIGGKGDFSEIFLGLLENFRGCISELQYNGLYLLEQARKRQAQSVVQSVTWNCAAEFTMDLGKEISFVEDNAFITISHVPVGTNLRFYMEFKTLTEECIFLYSSGYSKTLDLLVLAIEIWRGRLKLTMKYNSAQINLTNDVMVSDGRWHQLVIHISTTANLTVDQITSTTFLPRIVRNRYIEFPEVFFIGGIENEKKARAVAKSFKTFDRNFKGCIKNIVIEDNKFGLSNVKATEGIRPGCIWHFPCHNNPCSKHSKCFQRGLDSFQCQCDGITCLNSNYTKEYKVFSNSSMATDLELLSVKAVQVGEGDSVIITTENLHLVLDYHKYGIRESGIIFEVIESPSHGNLFVDIWPRKDNTFTLLDLIRDKVRYLHDGSENTKDKISMDLELSSSEPFILPAYLQGKNRLTLPVILTPTNDPPILETSNVLRIAQGTHEILTNKILRVIDPDSPADAIIYSLIKHDFKMVGYFEKLEQPGIPIVSFSQQEVNNQQIKFVHNGGSDVDSNIALQVTDGIATSKISFLRISTYTQHIVLQNNTGIILLYESAVIITPYNLSMVSNVKNSSHNIKYSIVSPPMYGVIEVERNGNWEQVNYFSSNDLEQNRVQYRHTSATPNYDEFKFFASLRNINSTSLTFRITFTRLKLIKHNNKHVLVNATVEVLLTQNELLYMTEPLWTNPMFITYKISKYPVYGYLTTHSKYRMLTDNSFTQEDINSAKIKYRLHRRSYSNITDSMSLIVSAFGSNYLTANITFMYHIDADLSSKIHAFIKPVQVKEGAKTNITVINLNLTINKVIEFTFNITEMPKHGSIQVINRLRYTDSTNYFTINELLNGLVLYIHDDSESQNDTFSFLAVSSEDDNVQYSGKLNIHILLKNDNKPIPKFNKVFHIVFNGKKLLTDKDLLYTDADIDTNASKIVYSCREITNGMLYRTNNSSAQEIYMFSQADLNNERIIFHHQGESYGRIYFSVSDGEFNVNGHLEVQASNPFIKILKSNKIIVEQGKSVFITSQELNILTNLNAKLHNIIYDVIEKPQRGKIVAMNRKQEIRQFSQTDVNSAQILYINDGSSKSSDEIKLNVHSQELSNIVTLSFKILPSYYWKPLLLVSNQTLYVEESTSIPVIKEHLEISQLEVPPNAITYYVAEQPQFGYLEFNDVEKNNTEYNRHFTQDSINQNNVRYVQSSANVTRDRIVFNVTNGIVWINNILLKVIVIPEFLYLGNSVLEVFEGSEATITTSHIFVLTDYYKNKVTDYLIIQIPKYGCIKTNNQCITSNNFSTNKLQSGLIKYVHNNSENFKDEISIIGIAGQKRSIPTTIYFKIIPVNDQIPSVANNTGLLMWEGGLAKITSHMLSAVDDDLPKETLTYKITGSLWGNVTLRYSKYPVETFTQKDIDLGNVMFKHRNGSDAKFFFTVSDGLHVTKEHVFQIKTKPMKLALHKLSNLHVFPLHRSYVTVKNILSIASDPDRVIEYEVVKPPNLGRLLMETEIPGSFKIVQYFTQLHINSSKIFYEHTHPFAGLYANDFFIFNIYTHLAETIQNKRLSIDISVSSGGLDSYLKIPNVEVPEGGVTNIQLNISEVASFLETLTGLNAPIIHLSASHPSHGYIYLTENSNTSVFTQSQIESGQIKYQHDHSDSLNDTVTLSLFLLPGYITLCNVSINIKIIPINDQPFRLVTVAPKITVVQGENYTLSQKDLFTEDADTNPIELKYVIITNPTQGKLVQILNNGEVQNASIVNSFTQADIDANKIMYMHSGKASQTSFYFRVWDGKFKPEYTLFNIEVIPAIMNVTSGDPIYLQQGSNVASVLVHQFKIYTNVAVNRLHFTINKLPRFGVLYVKDVSSNVFSYSDLFEKNVMYMQTDMSSASDSFELWIGILNDGNNVGSITEVMVKVQPLMQIGNLSVINGSKIKFSLSILDATPLAKLTSSNPKYVLVQKPLFGEIRKIIRSSGEKRNVVDYPVKVFTHEEVKSGLIYYITSLLKTNLKNCEEKLVFQLSSSIFQPAIGEIRFRILPDTDKKFNLQEPRNPAGHEGEMHISSRSISGDYFLILTVVTGVFVCGITVLVVLKCRHLHYSDKGKENNLCAAGKLSKMPEQLITASPYTKRYLSENLSIPTALTAQIPATVSVPQCKVTLLRQVNSLANSDLEVHSRYPYGTSEDQTEDWSSYDTSEPTYSTHNTSLMLRKNQYWV